MKLSSLVFVAPATAPAAAEPLSAANATASATVLEEPASRDVERSRRKRPVRARTESMKRMPKHVLELGRHLFPAGEHDDIERPQTRGDCVDGPRPCPFVACKHHLYLDISARTGAIKLNFPDLEPDQLTESCALDVAARQGATLEETGTIMNLTRERIRQVEVTAMAKISAAQDTHALRDFVDDVRPSKRRLPILHQEQEPDDGDDAELEAEDTFDAEEFASDALDPE